MKISDLGAGVESLFATGISAWKDIEVAKAYSPNDSRPATRDASGNSIVQGQDGSNWRAVLQGPMLQSAAIALAVGLLIYLVAKKL